MNNSRFRTNRKIELYENVCFNNKINELQNDIRHNRHQRLKSRKNERQNRFFVQQDSRERFYRTIHEFRAENQSNCKLNKALYNLKQLSKV
jgi:hypothetical protein